MFLRRFLTDRAQATLTITTGEVRRDTRMSGLQLRGNRSRRRGQERATSVGALLLSPTRPASTPCTDHCLPRCCDARQGKGKE
ncbi:hypothetical protein E2C01_046942 [Portunus trituberculatus]|uniref:Uncharacterized protein n=1 Tax=Portunus trituberculatus TaxID=210409 RepID=A0A5B7G7H5_PORTR|nr:hypothetical protein [Portunus trituberculatus]